jgi:hypothetical protein
MFRSETMKRVKANFERAEANQSKLGGKKP